MLGERAICRVVVEREELLNAFEAIRMHAPREIGEEAVISKGEAYLVIDLAGMSLQVAAVGEWQGEVRVAGEILRSLAHVPPSGGVIEIVLVGEKLQVGSSFFPCSWQRGRSREIELPLDAGLSDVLQLSMSYSLEELEAAGYAPAIRKAKEEAASLIEQAASFLCSLGISAETLTTMVMEELKKRR